MKAEKNKVANASYPLGLTTAIDLLCSQVTIQGDCNYQSVLLLSEDERCFCVRATVSMSRWRHILLHFYFIFCVAEPASIGVDID